MKALKIFIVEDEPLIASTIELALSKKGHQIVGEAEHVKSAQKGIIQSTPDLVLIDIQLEGDLTGVDLAIALDKIQLPYIFISSQTDPNTINRVKQTNPLGYIVKPFTENGLQTNIELAWHNYQNQYSDVLEFKSEGRLHNINQNQILYLKAFDNYCYVHALTKTYLVPHTLKHMSEMLNEEVFIKCHRSFVVNSNHIISVGTSELHLKSDTIPLSASQKSIVLSKLNSK